ncbi:MAG: hypothetical protein OXC19_19485 [Bryobacterales bacterium]|nr:hypothetical protein [Bryobacterales bacterium]
MESRSRAGYQHLAFHPNPGASFRLPPRERVLWVLGIWLPCLAYAIVRYNVLGGVAWTHLPLYIVNKSAALAGVVLVALAYLVGKLFGGAHGSERVRSKAKFLGLAGFSMITVHVLMAMVLLSPAYFEKFYETSGKFNLSGEMTFLCGVLAYGCLLVPAIATLPHMYDALGMGRWLRSQHMGYVALGLACGHTFSMGYKGWIDLASWPGRMPPITLLGFLCALLAVAVKLGAAGVRRSKSVPLGPEGRVPGSS